MVSLCLIPGLGYILLGWLNNIIIPALFWYALILVLSAWGYQLHKEFQYAKMTRSEVLSWHKRLSFFYFLIFTSWTLIFILYAGENESNMHYIAIFTQLGASVVAATLLYPASHILRPVLLMLILPLSIYFAMINELYGYILTLFSLIFLGVLFYGAHSSDRLLHKIHYQASHDQLTGLFNRHAFIDTLQQKVNGLEREKKFSYLLLIDLDHFKTINDTLGHDIGDKVLQEVALRLRNISGEAATIARLGGDEFVILGKEFASEDESLDNAMLISHSLLDALKETYIVNDHHLYLSASIGASLLTDKKLDANLFIKEADIAMYEVKEQGRDGVVLFNTELSKRVEKHLVIEQKLHFALEQNEISLNYQPQVNIQEEIIGTEVLVRWDNKELGSVSPETFITIAEQTGFMIELGYYILEESFKTLAKWDNEGIDLKQFSINISMRQLFYFKFVDDVTFLCKRYLTEALKNKIIFEMTETIAAEDIPRVVAIIDELSELGIRFSMDDFGTGYSSLSYLQKMPIHELKIDRSFIYEINQHKGENKMVNIILNMAKSFGLQVVAEGVETQSQAQFLKEHGCDILQGYLFAQPLSQEEFEEYYHQMKASVQMSNISFHI